MKHREPIIYLSSKDAPSLAWCRCADKRPGFEYPLCPRHNPKTYAAYASQHNTHRPPKG